MKHAGFFFFFAVKTLFWKYINFIDKEKVLISRLLKKSDK